MSVQLEVTSQVDQETKLGYDQISNETVVSTPDLTKTVFHGRGSKNERALTSTSKQNGAKVTEGESHSVGEKNMASNSVVSRVSVERANIGFQIAFSIPLTGIIPTAPAGSPNC